ncbi:hypothetical protein EPO05_02975 [Patescibacteria group bacterium]|nr:MAG: hypothetical protein EPO05_02975 [Patescibacteria group bacterium]
MAVIVNVRSGGKHFKELSVVDFEAALKQRLESIKLDGEFPGFISEKLKGSPHRKGVYVRSFDSRSIVFTVQTAGNDSCFAIRVMLPGSLNVRETFERLRAKEKGVDLAKPIPALVVPPPPPAPPVVPPLKPPMFEAGRKRLGVSEMIDDPVYLEYLIQAIQGMLRSNGISAFSSHDLHQLVIDYNLADREAITPRAIGQLARVMTERGLFVRQGVGVYSLSQKAIEMVAKQGEAVQPDQLARAKEILRLAARMKQAETEIAIIDAELAKLAQAIKPVEDQLGTLRREEEALRMRKQGLLAESGDPKTREMVEAFMRLLGEVPAAK